MTDLNAPALLNIRAVLRRLENAWNSSDNAAWAGLCAAEFWLIDGHGQARRIINSAELRRAVWDTAGYCVLVVEQVVLLSAAHAYATVKFDFHDEAETVTLNGVIVLLVEAPSADWRICLLHMNRH